MSNVGPFLTTLLANQTVDETTSEPADCRGYEYLTVVVAGTGTTSSGVVTIEQAFYNPMSGVPYGGTWSPIQTVNASDATAGQQKAVQLTVADYGFLRARISTAIGGGGNITVLLSGH